MSQPLPLSILDLVPVAEGSDAPTALKRSLDLARLGDHLGYQRIWYAEHHSIASIGSSSPEVIIGHAAAHTKRIRVGSGGVMLPNHVPLRIVETYRTLNALYDGRIDLGIGRAGGTDGRTLSALRSANGEDFPHLVAEMLAFERGGFPADHPYAGIKSIPEGVALPPVTVLGSSGASAAFAGANGFGYGFAAHFSQAPAAPAFAAYRQAFRPSEDFVRPHALLCVAALAAPTAEEADYLSGSMRLMWRNLFANEPGPIPSPETAAAYPYTEVEKRALDKQMKLLITGTPDEVAARIGAMADEAGADEVMIATTAYGHEERLRSYRLIAQALGLKQAA